MSTHAGRGLNLSRREIALSLCVMLFGGVLCYYAVQPMREEARANSCASNLKQIGIALQMYAGDNSGIFPRAWSGKNNGPSDTQTNYKWMDAILPYSYDKKEDFFICPSDNVNPRYRFRSGTNYGSYVINNAYFASGDNLTPPAGRRDTEFTRPSETIFVTDGENDFQFAWPDAQREPPLIGSNPLRLNSITARHKAIIPMPLFCDGHVLGNRMAHYLHAKSINGLIIYTALTIEDD